MTKLYGALIEELARAGIPGTKWAVSAGINPSQPSVLRDGRRPDIKTLTAIAHGWDDPAVGIRLIAAHLRDEIERVDLTADQIDIIPHEDAGAPDAPLEASLRTLDAYIRSSPSLREAIIHLAEQLPDGDDLTTTAAITQPTRRHHRHAKAN